MKKKTLAILAVSALCVTGAAFATPQTTFEKGQTQIDLGAWNPKAEVSDVSTDAKWNFQGGLTYGLSDKWALQYQYYGLKTEGSSETDGAYTDGNEHEVNLLYSLNKNFALYGGWNRIKNSLVYDGGNAFEKTNNVAQLGLVAKAPIAGNLDIYGKAAVGTQKTAMWEAGLGYAITKDLDINAGYRYLNTKATDDYNVSYKGFIAGLSYRFGGSTPVAPAPVETPAPEPAPVVETPAPHVYKDYYVDSIHFDFDVDTPMASEQAKLDNFVSVAKANPGNTFKLVGNTDAKGTDTYNNDLSKRRVTNVGNYAISHGVPAAQLQATYRGENDPVSTNDTDQGRADNRRVDIFMHK
jgi:OOP family OmpA-OmpF porin